MMKKIFSLVLILVLGKISHSQSYPLQQNLGSDSTIVISKGALQSRIIPIVVSDTNAANAQRMKNYPGAQLYTTSGDFYIRNYNTTKWVLVSSGSSGSVNIYTADGTLTGNRTLTGAGNNLTFDGLNKFTVNTADSVLFNTNTFDIKGVGGVLNVEGTAAGTTSSLTLKTASDGNWTISTGQVNFNSGDLRFYDNDNGANRMIIKPSGNVGIGTETPDSLLTVNGGVYVGGGIRAPGLPTALGTKALRINAQGQISVADTTLVGGTVISVGTNNGSGITGGPITVSGTLAIDTTNVIATKASVTGGLAGKLNISDTASMLSPYLRKADTTAMLAPYLRAIDTASLSNRINLKLNISDTASMLGNYLNNVGYGLSKAGQIVSADSATLSNYYLRRKDSLTATNPLGYVTKQILADTAAAIRSSDLGGTVTSVATNNGTGITGGTITTSGTLAIDTTVISTRAWRQKGIDSVASLPRVTSVGLTMPSAFNVSGSPVTSAGTLSVTGAGLVSQYIRGDGTLADFPGGGGGGGASVSYYLNGSVNQGTFVGNTYYQMSKTPIFGTGTNFTINADGYIAQFITDSGNPGLLKIPGGNWNFETFFSASSGGGTPTYYVELYKYDGTTFTLIASGSTNPDVITGGTSVEAYFSTLPVPETVLTLTDRLAVRIYVTHAGRTITLHTEDNNLCQVITTFTTGITALNGLTEQVQYFTTGTSGTDFNISSSVATHTFNLPTASATNRGALSTTDWSTFNNKIGPSDTTSMLSPYLRKADTTAMLANYINNVGYALSKVGQVVSVDSSTLSNYYLRRKDSLTATNLLGYVTRTILADTAAAIRGADAGGTVTSVATNNGTGITGGTITTSGTLAIDTTVISTRAWRQKGVDSVAALINSNVSGTTNYVPKFTGTNTLGNSIIYESSGIIGIGTTTPAVGTKLDVDGGIRGQFFNVYKSGSGVGFLGSEADLAGGALNNLSLRSLNSGSSITFFTSNSVAEKMRLDASGNLGIGVTPSSWVSTWKAIQGNNGSFAVASGGNGMYLLSNAFYNTSGSPVYTTSTEATMYQQVNGLHIWYNAPSGTAGNTISWTSAMTLDASGNLGIGTTSPSYKLSVLGGSLTNMISWTDNVNNTGYLGIRSTAASIGADNNLLFETGATERMRITSGGNVGIGTSSPNGNAATTGLLHLNGSSTNAEIHLTNTTTGTTGTDGGIFLQYGNQLILFNLENDAMLFGTNNTERMRITSGGNVGIGTTSPSTALHTFGRIRSSNTSTTGTAVASGVFEIGDNSNGIWRGDANSITAAGNYTHLGGYDGIIFTSSNASIGSQSERMRITSGGLVGIGVSSPSEILDVRNSYREPTSGEFTQLVSSTTTQDAGRGGSIGFGGYYSSTTSFTSFSGIKGGKENGDGGNTAGNLIFYTRANAGAVTERMRITSGGEVYIAGTTDQGAYNLQVNGTGVWGAGAYVDGSDSALKRNIQPLGNSLEIIKQMRPVTFEYQPFYSKDTATQTGFIAQELQQLLAGKVYKNGVVKEGGAYLGVAYQSIIPLLVQAVKELEAEVQSLKSQLKQ